MAGESPEALNFSYKDRGGVAGVLKDWEEAMALLDTHGVLRGLDKAKPLTLAERIDIVVG